MFVWVVSASMYDYIIVGGGIIGTSTAWQLQKRRPDRKILIIEKEEQVACHQTGHNSGVIHAGVYYQPGSLKAKFCKQGVIETVNFCRQQGIPFERCGKLLVATDDIELERMPCTDAVRKTVSFRTYWIRNNWLNVNRLSPARARSLSRIPA